MNIFKPYLNTIFILCLTVLLSGFTNLTKEVSPPKDIPKRTEDKNAGIVIPSFEASPYEIIEKSYDPLNAFMLDSEEGIFMALSTSNFDFNPHKLTFHHKKLGFVTHNAFRVGITFEGDTKPQKMSNFFFSPFEISNAVPKEEITPIAENWVKFFDSLGWKRLEEDPQYPYKRFPKEHAASYMKWRYDEFQLTLSVVYNSFESFYKKSPRYYLIIVFDPNPDGWKKNRVVK